MDDSDYPRRPDGVPSDLAVPSRTYRRQAWAAVAALLGFSLLYFGSMCWLGLTAWGSLAGAARSGGHGVAGFLLAIPSLFLLAFLAKGIFFVKRGEIGDAIEMKPEDEPGLFAFIHRVAHEAGAPRPHRVFLTPGVNASVFYDLSFRNLVWPSKKNLNIGLGLVNALTLDEFKAVLAHEYGHFAQRTMAVGSWVYVAQQAIGAIVARRDGFDRFLEGLSRVDLRLAWIGWVMRLVVWSIRVVFDTGFRGLQVLQRALSREMEFQADLVSVSLCGSDSIVHALRRLGPADEAMSRALAFAAGEGRLGTPVADVYEVQTGVLAELRRIWRDSSLGEVPERPASEPERHRVFTQGIAEVPRMWSTHPPSHEREENAKARYVASTLDARSAWAVFADPASVRRRMTSRLYQLNMPEAAKAEVAAGAETLARLAAGFARVSFDERWLGVYVGRSVVRGVRSRSELSDDPPTDPESIRAALHSLYPASIVGTLRSWREAEEGVSQLEALADGVLQAPGGVIRFRGRTIHRRELAAVVKDARAERDALRDVLAVHDRSARTAHRAAARAIGDGWESFLTGLAGLLHYLEHLGGDLEDAEGVLSNVLRVVTAGGRVSSAEVDRLVSAGNEVHRSLQGIHDQARAVRLSEPVEKRLGSRTWVKVLGEDLKLGPASREALAANWLPAASTWVTAARNALDAAAAATLDTLIEMEAHVARCFLEGAGTGEAPLPPKAPADYPILIPGHERKRQKRLGWWERFQLADGWAPGAARFGVAAAVLVPAFLLTQGVSSATIGIHNGLAIPVVVDVGSSRGHRVSPGQDARITISSATGVAIEARTNDGLPVEHFKADADDFGATYVYNVAGADVLAIVSIGYGTDRVPGPVIVGTSRWYRSTTDHTLEDPPSSISSSAPTVHTRLVHLAEVDPGTRLGLLSPSQRVDLARTHLRWDPISSPLFSQWAYAAAHFGVDVLPMLRERTEQRPGDVVLGRIEQDLGGPAVCAEHRAAAEARPDDPDSAYLALRCLPDSESGPAFRAALARFPDHPWIGWGVAWEQLRDGQWAEADATLKRVGTRLSLPVEYLVMTRLRALRMADAPLDAQLSALGEIRERRSWAFLLAADAGEPGRVDAVTDTFSVIAAARARGDLRWAGLLTAQHRDLGWQVWMNAGSDGAPKEMVEGALALPEAEGLDASSVWVAAAVLAREGRDRSAVEALAKRADPHRLLLLQPVLEASRPADVIRAVDQAVIAASALDRGWIHLVGVIRLGDAAPESWRREARALVLPWERPYIRPAAAGG